MRIKRNIKVLFSIVINNFKLLRLQKIGSGSHLGSGLIVNGRIRETITIGKNVCIGKRARLGNSFGIGKGISISDNCVIGNDFTAIDGQIIVEENCLIADDVSLIAANHQMNPDVNRGYKGNQMVFDSIRIGKGCWIGEKTIVLPGVEIGEYSIIGAGSVVTKSVPPFSMAVGNPAHIIKHYDTSQKEWIRL